MKISVTEIAERADALYAARHEMQNVWQSVELLDASLAQEFDYELAWRQGRALFFLGQEAPDQAQARAFYKRAIKICRQAARVQAARVEGHFWLGVNLALLAALEKPFKALPQALTARRALGHAIAINSAYHAAGPLRVLARLESKLPAWLGGGTTRARTNFEKAIALAPSNTVTRLYFSELLLATGDEQSARSQLEAILAAPDDSDWAFEIARDRRLAQAMLKKAKVKR